MRPAPQASIKYLWRDCALRILSSKNDYLTLRSPWPTKGTQNSFFRQNPQNRFAGGSLPKGRRTYFLGKDLKIGLPEAAYQRDTELILLVNF